jgi:uncharacterized protein YprB with RNaseH-like and TPR domain
MLMNTFIHLPYIGLQTEQNLWHQGLQKWDDILKPKIELPNKFEHLHSPLSLSKHKLKQLDAKFFTDRLRTDQHWRIFPEFQEQTAYIDIETTGLGAPKDHITTIALYDGKNVKYYVHGKNLEQFISDIMKYKALVSYNGKTFDVPFIEREFGLKLPHAHLDLRYILRSIGISGGLKSCEHQLGLGRGDLEGIDGYFAVFLWKDYLKGNDKALDTLIAYNIEDTVNLEKLMYIAYERKLKGFPLNKKVIVNEPRAQKTIKIPFGPDAQTIQKIKEKYY